MLMAYFGLVLKYTVKNTVVFNILWNFFCFGISEFDFFFSQILMLGTKEELQCSTTLCKYKV